MSARGEEIRLFLEKAGRADAQLSPLAGDASFRHYIRLRSGQGSAMLMDAPPEREKTGPFLAVAEILASGNYSAPAVLARDSQAGLLLLEDLGDDSFSAVLRRSPGQEAPLYSAAIDLLSEWHGGGLPAADVLPAYSTDLLLDEASLLADWFLPRALGEEPAAALREEYREIWRAILTQAPLLETQFVHRDYHADNLMWLPQREGTRRVGLLDFQDAVRGDPAYDLVSLLEDARRDVPDALVKDMLARYVRSRGDAQRLHAAYAVLGAQRNSKIVGIFTRLAVRDGKQGYQAFMPRVWQHLERDLTHPMLAPLREWMQRHVPVDKRLAA